MDSRAISVLIVEDHRDGAETLAVLLDMFGYEVRIACDGASAMRLARTSPPDAVILDIGLPGKDGFAVARELRAMLERKPLLIAVTGYTNMQAECLAAGFDLYYAKPVEPTVIDVMLREHAKLLAAAVPG